MTRNQWVTGNHRIDQTYFNRGFAYRCSNLVHLRFVSETGLNDSKATHGATWRVIRSHCIAIDRCVVALIWSLSVRDAIYEHSWGSAGVSATVKNKTSIDLDNLSVRVSVMTHKYGRWVTVHVPKKTLFATVLHFDWATCLKGEQTTVNLKADVFACTECAANSAECEPNLVSRKIEAGRYLREVFMQPLSCYM